MQEGGGGRCSQLRKVVKAVSCQPSRSIGNVFQAVAPKLGLLSPRGSHLLGFPIPLRAFFSGARTTSVTAAAPATSHGPFRAPSFSPLAYLWHPSRSQQGHLPLRRSSYHFNHYLKKQIKFNLARNLDLDLSDIVAVVF